MPTERITRASYRLPVGVQPDTVHQFRGQLEQLHGAPIDLRINDNTSTLLSMNRPRGAAVTQFSMHKMFLSAEPTVLEALAQYLRRPTERSRQVLRHFMDSRTDEIRAREVSQKTLNLRTRGSTYNLHELTEQVNREFFNNEVRVYVTWSRGSAQTDRHRRHIIFGSYQSSTKLVRIHPSLDHPSVPEYFVKFVLFHEMLHAVLDPKPQPGGRRCVHTPAFRDREKRHPDYKRCMEWEKHFMSGTIE